MRKVNFPSTDEQEAEFKRQAEQARSMAGRATLQEDQGYWLDLAQRWDKMAKLRQTTGKGHLS